MGNLPMSLQFVLVFVAAFFVDWLWAAYILATSQKRPFAASFYGALIFTVGALVTISYIENKILLISGALGGAIGTFTYIKFRGDK